MLFSGVMDPYAVSLIATLCAGGLIAVVMGSERGLMICYGLMLVFIALLKARYDGDPALAVLTTALLGLIGLIIVVPLAYLAAYLGAASATRQSDPQE